jgi:hypothetical protein
MKHVYQPYRASTLARELQTLSDLATPPPWENGRASVMHDRPSRVTATAMLHGYQRDKTRAGVVCETTDMQGRHSDQLEADTRLIATMRNNVEAFVSLLNRVDALETALEFYANRDHYDYRAPALPDGPALLSDKGTVARAALFNIPEDEARTRAWPPAPGPHYTT